ncbi:MAG TPA: glycosyltransferase family 87 protein [Roseiflexaceae bacterium]|nr:glycosyltransferase family 87 protein [Roseiflexaceae bacterium]
MLSSTPVGARLARPGIRLLVNALACLLIVAYLAAISPLLQTDEDFGVYYKAAQTLRAGGNIYTVQSYTYGPLFAWLFQPLAILPLSQARMGWFLVQVACLSAFIWLAIRISGARLARRYWGVVALCSFVATPTYLDLVLGQIGGCMALLTLAGYCAIRRQPWWPGWWLGLAITFKLYPALLWLGYIWRRQWRMVAMVALSCCLLLVLTAIVCGWQNVSAFASYLTQRSDYPYGSEHNVSLAGFWLRAFTNNGFVIPLLVLPVAAYAAIALSSIVVVGACVAVGQPAEELGDMVQFSMFLCAMLLLFPASGIYNLNSLLFPILVAVRAYETYQYRSTVRWLLIVVMSLYLPPLSSLISIANIQRMSGVFLYFTPTTYSLLALFGLLVALMRRIHALPQQTRS